MNFAIAYSAQVDYSHITDWTVFAVPGQRIWWMTKSQSGELLQEFMDYLHWNTCCHTNHRSQKPCDLMTDDNRASLHVSHYNTILQFRFYCCVNLHETFNHWWYPIMQLTLWNYQYTSTSICFHKFRTIISHSCSCAPVSSTVIYKPTWALELEDIPC